MDTKGGNHIYCVEWLETATEFSNVGKKLWNSLWGWMYHCEEIYVNKNLLILPMVLFSQTWTSQQVSTHHHNRYPHTITTGIPKPLQQVSPNHHNRYLQTITTSISKPSQQVSPNHHSRYPKPWLVKWSSYWNRLTFTLKMFAFLFCLLVCINKLVSK